MLSFSSTFLSLGVGFLFFMAPETRSNTSAVDMDFFKTTLLAIQDNITSLGSRIEKLELNQNHSTSTHADQFHNDSSSLGLHSNADSLLKGIKLEIPNEDVLGWTFKVE